MVEIAIVEDRTDALEQLESLLKQYSAEYKTLLQIHTFTNAVSFLENYTARYDMVFMDILMPMLNGLDAARALREKDEKVILIFVTSMQQYAIRGYEVAATDFIVKPVTYPQFKLKFTRFLDRLSMQPKHTSTDILVKTETGFVRLLPSRIRYVEVRGHHCVYHTEAGDYRQYQSMKSAAEQLEDCGFAKCNNYLLVNLSYVTRMDGMSAYIGSEELPISHPRKNEFTKKLTEYMESRRYE